jgi:ADP-ribose pyrophosphatase YjhB (NUDIX family)
MPRPQVVRPAAYVLLEDSGRILLCRLSKQSTADGFWTLPGGGLEFGEIPAAGAIREAYEETGLNVELSGEPIIDSEVDAFLDVSVQHLRFFYRAHITGGELRPEADGTTDECRWFSPAEAEAVPTVGIAKQAIRILFGS